MSTTNNSFTLSWEHVRVEAEVQRQKEAIEAYNIVLGEIAWIDVRAPLPLKDGGTVTMDQNNLIALYGQKRFDFIINLLGTVFDICVAPGAVKGRSDLVITKRK